MKTIPFFLATLLAIGTSWADVVVVGHPSVPVNKLSDAEATQIYLRQLQTWPDGSAIKPLDMGEASALRAEFYAKVTGRSVGQVRAYWARQAFTGMGIPPQKLESPEEMLKQLESTPGAVGYLTKVPVGKGVKVLLDTAQPQ